MSRSPKIKWMILGASGQLGREWCISLQQENARYISFSRNELDITDESAVKQALDTWRPEMVVNCAAYTKVDLAEDVPDLADAINHRACHILAQECSKNEVLLIHYSTDYVFPGRLEHRKIFPHGYPVDGPAEPVNIYGRSKWLGEEKIRAYADNYLIIRVSWLCSNHGANFVSTMLRLANERNHLKVVNDQFGCPTFTSSVVFNTIKLVEEGVTGTIHASSLGETTWYEFAKKIFHLRGTKMQLEPIPTSGYPVKAARPAWSLLDIRPLADVTGTRILPWEDELRNVLK